MLWHRYILFIILVLFPLVAGANHPQPDQMEKVKLIAHELEGGTAKAYQLAFRYAGAGWREHYALQHLQFLERAARHFHQQVEAFFKNPEHTEHDYQSLGQAYHDADYTLYDLSAYRYWDFSNQWRNVEQLMSDLAFYYEGEGPNPYPTPVQVVITQIEQGGNFFDTTLRLHGYIDGGGLTGAGVFVDGILRELLHVSPLSTRHPLYTRLKWPRFSGQHLVEIRVQLHGTPEQTVWSQLF